MPYIRRDQAMAPSGLFVIGVTAGLFAFVLCVGIITTGSMLLWALCVCASLLGACGLVLMLHRYIGAYDRAGMLGLGYGLGLTALPSVGMMMLFRLKPVIPVVLLVATMVSCLMALATWALIRRARWAVHLYDEGACHRCRYTLTGNTSGVCPECGTVVISLAE